MVNQGVCIIVDDRNIEEVVEYLGVTDFKYQALFDSENRIDYYESLGMDMLHDNNVFSESINELKNLQHKGKSHVECGMHCKRMVEQIFEKERQFNILRNYRENGNLVLILASRYGDRAAKSPKNLKLILTPDQMDILMTAMINTFYNIEGLKIRTLEDYKMGLNINPEKEFSRFMRRQEELAEQEESKCAADILKHFNTNFQFRLLAYYTKLRGFTMFEIMDQLDRLGYLDERFDDCLIDEEKARRILAKRLCTLSFREDIDVLIKNNILKPDAIQYNLDVVVEE